MGKNEVISNDGGTKSISDEVTDTDISLFCPEINGLVQQSNLTVTFFRNVTNCTQSDTNLPSSQGIVYGYCQDSISFCHLHVKALQHKIIKAQILAIPTATPCRGDPWSVHLYGSRPLFLTSNPSFADGYVSCWTTLSPGALKFCWSTNNAYMSFYNMAENFTEISVQKNEKRFMTLHYPRQFAGYMKAVIPAGVYLNPTDFWKDVNIPAGFLVAIKFKAYESFTRCLIYLRIFLMKDLENPTVMMHVCRRSNWIDKVLNTSHLRFNLLITKTNVNITLYVLLLYHPTKPHQIDPKLLSSAFECTTGHQKGKYCQKLTHCEDGQEEKKHCPAQVTGCRKWYQAENKCLEIVTDTHSSTNKKASENCKIRGGHLASLKTKLSFVSVSKWLLDFLAEYDSVHIGLTVGWYRTPFIYRQFPKWSDNTVMYTLYPCPFWWGAVHYTPTTYFTNGVLEKRNTGSKTTILVGQIIPALQYRSYMCEFGSQIEKGSVAKNSTLPVLGLPPAFQKREEKFRVCPGRHFTQSFLACDLQSHCGHVQPVSDCTLTPSHTSNTMQPSFPSSTKTRVAMFACDDEYTTIPFTLVCDSRQDCLHGGDESFCQHPPCAGFRCQNGQCVLQNQCCNGYSDCLDDSDELVKRCGVVIKRKSPCPQEPEERLVVRSLDGTGYFTQVFLTDQQHCPHTHYQCTNTSLDCLPVYTRCNGVYDCPFQEDEQECERATCSGFYKCRSSTVCVHHEHVCDGWSQCPQRDDESLCDVTCPRSCLCQGLSFVCSHYFDAHSFPHLRYLDATGSEMMPSDLRHNLYLIRLKLSNCSLVSVSFMSFPNMQFLDLSDNRFTNITMNVFLRMTNLRFLSLAGNPLTSLKKVAEDVTQNALKKIDLSGTHLYMFDSGTLAQFPKLESINISFCAIELLGGFQATAQLQEIDVRGNGLTNFSTDMFLGVSQLSRIYSSNYRLCCAKVVSHLPKLSLCMAPEPVLSSCEHLLSTRLYTAVFWLLCLSAVCGNLTCFITQCARKEGVFDSSALAAFVNLQASYLCSGIHSIIIVSANELLHGEYMLYERRWTTSEVCRLAAVFSLLSSNTSLLVVWLLTFQQVVIFCFPGRVWSFTRMSTFVSLVAVWMTGLILTSTPLLLGPLRVGLSDLSGSCHLSYLTTPSSAWKSALFHFLAIFRLTLCVMIGMGQLLAYWATPKYRITCKGIKKDAVRCQHLVMKVGVTTLLCQGAVTVLHLMDLAGTAVSVPVSVVVSTFAPAVSGAVYPLWYCWSWLTNNKQQEHEELLLQVWRARILSSQK